MRRLTVFALLLAGCSQANVSAPLPSAAGASAAAERPAGKYRVVFVFNSSDGSGPRAPVLAIANKLYGTTVAGASNHGVLFSLTPGGKERILHYFGGSPDGSGPDAGLTYADGLIYGTTKSGGKNNDGTVFTANLTGREHVLYSFKGGDDGRQPHSALLFVNGLFYGTTYSGGQFDVGTAYEISKGGTELLLHTFGKNYREGIQPNADFIKPNDNLYSTAYGGGSYRKGVAYSMTLNGTEHALHSFGRAEDGRHPYNAALAQTNGAFYGTTCSGGIFDLGAVFLMTKTGAERIIYSFGKNAHDPICPAAGLVRFNGLLYGTSYLGGYNNNGTLFSISDRGKVTVLHDFGTSGDGAQPFAALTVLGDRLYGTTYGGGDASGDGTIFSYQP